MLRQLPVCHAYGQSWRDAAGLPLPAGAAGAVLRGRGGGFVPGVLAPCDGGAERRWRDSSYPFGQYRRALCRGRFSRLRVAQPVHLARGLWEQWDMLRLHQPQTYAMFHAPDDHESAGWDDGGSQEPLRPGQPPNQSAKRHCLAELGQLQAYARGLRVPRSLAMEGQMESPDPSLRQAIASRTLRRSGRGGAGMGP
jgi:hypothetical protein